MAAPNPAPLQLTKAELAAAYQTLGLLAPAGSAGLAELDVTPAALAGAQAGLVALGVLRPGVEGAAALAPEARAVFETVARPRLLCVLQSRQPGSGERRVTFSWTPAALVVNTLAAEGSHRLERLPALEAVAERALSESGVPAAHPAAASAPAADLADLAQRATHRALFLMVAQASGARPATEAWSWLVSDGQLWVIAPRGPEQASLAAISAPALQALLNERVARAAAAAQGAG